MKKNVICTVYKLMNFSGTSDQRKPTIMSLHLRCHSQRQFSVDMC